MLTAFRSGFKGSNGKNEQIKLIRAEVNGFSGRRISHEWAACGFREWPVL